MSKSSWSPPGAPSLRVTIPKTATPRPAWTAKWYSLRQSLHDPLAGVDLVVDEFCNVGSFAIDLPLAFGLAKRIGSHLADPATTGVVITHGTDTIEEKALT